MVDHDSFGGAGVDEIAPFEEDAHVGELAAVALLEVEEEQVALFHPSFPDAFAVELVNVGHGAVQLLVVDVLVHGTHESRAVDALAGGAAETVGGAQPLADFPHEGNVVLFVHGESQLAGQGLRFRLGNLQALRAAGRQEEDKE